MPKHDLAIINCMAYEGKDTFLGISEVTLPTVASPTQSFNGVGMSGTIEAALIGQLEAMTTTINFRNFTAETVKLSTPRKHRLELHCALQSEDSGTGDEVIDAVKHIMIVFPKSITGGKVSRATTGDPSGEYAVRYWATYIRGKRVLELDPVNNIYFMDGKDYLAPVRKAMGM